MGFLITNESVEYMREIKQRLAESVEKLSNANKEIINCYEDVKQTVGPHTRQIERITRDIEKTLKILSKELKEVFEKLNLLISSYEEVLEMMPESFSDRREKLMGQVRVQTKQRENIPLKQQNNTGSEGEQRERDIFDEFERG